MVQKWVGWICVCREEFWVKALEEEGELVYCSKDMQGYYGM